MINLVKLCVGAKTPDELEMYQAKRGGDPSHVTRMRPKREVELLAGGSIYWVFQGEIRARQKIKSFEEVIGDDGIKRCRLVFFKELVRVRPTPRRAFQGWRYLSTSDAPDDLEKDDLSLPEDLTSELDRLGIG